MGIKDIKQKTRKKNFKFIFKRFLIKLTEVMNIKYKKIVLFYLNVKP